MLSAFLRRHARASSLATVALAATLPLTLATTSADAVTSRTATATKQVAVVKTAKLGPRAMARAMVTGKKYGWSKKQYSCLNALWARESSWRVHAGSTHGGPYGIPQAYPGKKMGDGWRHNAKTQITWGLKYIDGRYGTPCAADKHQRATYWY